MMSNSAPTAASTAALPADPPTAALAGLRAEIDRLDDAIHDLLMARAEVVARVAAQGGKGGVALRPGREADIVRRLLARNRAPFPARAVVRIWRELLAATTSIQGPFAVATCAGEPGLARCAREHFGALTPLGIHHTPVQAMAAVADGQASVAVLPLPVVGEPSSWWPALLRQGGPRLFVVARLPFWVPRGEDAGCPPALVLAAGPPDPSAADRTLIGLDLPHAPDTTHVAEALTAAGFAPGALVLHDSSPAPVALADVAGSVAEGDPRLAALAASRHAPVVLGAYAIPVEEDAA